MRLVLSTDAVPGTHLSDEDRAKTLCGFRVSRPARRRTEVDCLVCAVRAEEVS